MKKIKQVLYITILLCIHTQVSAQFITINKKQFYNQAGQPFYPIICNYNLELAYDPTVTPDPRGAGDLVIHPYFAYGDAGYGYDDNGTTLAQGPARILSDFKKMKAMGFNAARVFGLDFQKLNGTPGGGFFRARKFPSPQMWEKSSTTLSWESDVSLGATSPFNTNSGAAVVFNKINELLDLAQEADISIILLCGRGFVSNNDANAADYAEYLTALADNLKNRTELLAYDLDNEPSFGTWMDNNDVGRPGISIRSGVKNKICSYVNSWYDAIKTTDPHHLVTMNNTTPFFDLFNYDPTTLNIDFNSIHFYPFGQAFEQFSWQASLDHIKMQLYWMSKNTPIPYIVGETGFYASVPAGNTTQYLCNVGPGGTALDISLPPVANGNYDDQELYAAEIQQIALNYGASGFSWWEFQDYAGGTGPYSYCLKVSWGLLESGPVVFNAGEFVHDNSLDKPYVSTTFGSNIITSANGPASQPTNYYNPYGASSTTNYTVTGTITDDDGNPISDALIKCSNNDNFHVVPNPDLMFEVFTFSRPDGTFELVSPIAHTYSTDYSVDYSKFVGNMSYAGPATSVGSFDCDLHLPELPDGTGGNITAQSFTPLHRSAGALNRSIGDVSNIAISAGNSPAIFTGRHMLDVNVVVTESDGKSDFHASTEVDLKPGFESVLGSETDVYIAQVNFDCDEMTSPVAYKTDDSHKSTKAILKTADIEVQYHLVSSGLRLRPNPASDKIFIESDQSVDGLITISNTTGSVVYTQNLFIDKMVTLPITDLPDGCYLVRVNSVLSTETFKLIVTKN